MSKLSSLMLQLRLLAVQPDQGNNIVLAEKAVMDFMASVPPNPKDQLRTLESVDTEVAGSMQSDLRASQLLEIVREYISESDQSYSQRKIRNLPIISPATGRPQLRRCGT